MTENDFYSNRKVYTALLCEELCENKRYFLSVVQLLRRGGQSPHIVYIPQRRCLFGERGRKFAYMNKCDFLFSFSKQNRKSVVILNLANKSHGIMTIVTKSDKNVSAYGGG